MLPLKPQPVWLAATLLLLPALATAGMRCPSGAIVHQGDTKTEVELVCGTPQSKSYEGIIERQGRWVNLDRWVYNPGQGRFYQILDFHDGTLVTIRNGPRVR